MKRIAVTGGIACGKSRFAEALRKLGVETLDADDIVHELVPEDERRRLARVAFRDPAVRAELEARLHPLVAARFDDWFGGGASGVASDAAPCRLSDKSPTTTTSSLFPIPSSLFPLPSSLSPLHLKAAIIPLLFEVHWEEKYDIICAVICSEEKQIERMMQRRGLTRREAEERLAAQMPTAEKAARSHYVIRNEGTTEELERKAAEFVSWLNEKKEEGLR